MKAVQTPLEELRQSDLKHYDKLSTECQHWSISVPRAINFYYDYRQMSLLKKIILAFKKNKI